MNIFNQKQHQKNNSESPFFFFILSMSEDESSEISQKATLSQQVGCGLKLVVSCGNQIVSIS